MLEVEMFALGYLAVSVVSAALFWLAQREGLRAGTASEIGGLRAMLVVLLVTGLAWPITLPLAAYGWLKELRVRRRSER